MEVVTKPFLVLADDVGLMDDCIWLTMILDSPPGIGNGSRAPIHVVRYVTDRPHYF